MSADNQSTTTVHAPYHLCLAPTLSEAAQTTIAALLHFLPTHCIYGVQLNGDAVAGRSALSDSTLIIKSMVDGRGLACPMPLLKTKVALRNVGVGESLYVVATDPNSQADITAFCQQTQQTNAANPLLLIVNQTTSQSFTEASAVPASDTIFHFIITKTDSN